MGHLSEDENLQGDLEATWALMNDWTEWQYTLGNQSGWIRLRNKRDPNIWEVVGGGQILEIRTIFPNEFDRWQVRYRSKTYEVRMYRRDPEQWQLKESAGKLFFYTWQEGDLRDWVIESETDFPVPLQIALTFVPILQLILP